MKLRAYAYTNRGGRDHNEDALRASAEDGVFVLADGLGGHRCGEVASALAVDALFTGMVNAEHLDGDGLAGAVPVRQRGDPPPAGPARAGGDAHHRRGPEDRRRCGGLGPYRGLPPLPLLTAGRLAEVTADHSVTYRKFLGGEISYMDIYHDDDRGRLLRVLGKEPCRPEAGGAAAEPGDAFLLCSDGFWEYVYTEEMQADLCKAPSPEAWAESMLLRHIRRTPPENDNFSLIAVFVEECG